MKHKMLTSGLSIIPGGNKPGSTVHKINRDILIIGGNSRMRYQSPGSTPIYCFENFSSVAHNPAAIDIGKLNSLKFPGVLSVY